MAIWPYFAPIKHSPSFLFFAALALLILTLGVSLPSPPKIFGVLNNFAHAPVFGVFALITLRLIRAMGWGFSRRAIDYGIALTVTLSVGALVEVAQIFMERDASLGDLATDTLGAGCALGINAALDRQLWLVRRSSIGRVFTAIIGLLCGLWALVPLAKAAVAYHDRSLKFPVLAQFSSARDLYFISSGSANLSLQEIPAQWAQPDDDLSLRVDFKNKRWPGVSHNEPEADWRGFSTLLLDVINPAEAPLRITVRVHDKQHDQRHEDRFNRTYELPASTREVLRIPINDILTGPVDRLLDLAHIAGIVVFESSRPAPVGGHIYLNRIWLE